MFIHLNRVTIVNTIFSQHRLLFSGEIVFFLCKYSFKIDFRCEILQDVVKMKLKITSQHSAMLRANEIEIDDCLVTKIRINSESSVGNS